MMVLALMFRVVLWARLCARPLTYVISFKAHRPCTAESTIYFHFIDEDPKSQRGHMADRWQNGIQVQYLYTNFCYMTLTATFTHQVTNKECENIIEYYNGIQEP